MRRNAFVSLLFVLSGLLTIQRQIFDRRAVSLPLPPGARHVPVSYPGSGPSAAATSSALLLQCQRFSEGESGSKGVHRRRTVTVLFEAGLPFSGTVSFEPVFEAFRAGRGSGNKSVQEDVDLLLCTYDRAGYGWSPAAPDHLSRDVSSQARELATVLTTAQLSPDVLVGWSYGGLLAHVAVVDPELSALEAFQNVRGVVLVDPVVPADAQNAAFMADVQRGAWSFAALAAASPLAVSYLLQATGASRFFPEAGFAQASWPARPRAWAEAFTSGRQFPRTARAELEALPKSLAAGSEAENKRRTLALSISRAGDGHTSAISRTPARRLALLFSGDVPIDHQAAVVRTFTRTNGPYSKAKVTVERLDGIDHYVPLHAPERLLQAVTTVADEIGEMKMQPQSQNKADMPVASFAALG